MRFLICGFDRVVERGMAYLGAGGFAGPGRAVLALDRSRIVGHRDAGKMLFSTALPSQAGDCASLENLEAPNP